MIATLIDVYCDGSISRSILNSYAKSGFSKYVGRTIVVIPSLDYGIIEMFHDNLLLSNQEPNAMFAEMLAAQRAGHLCQKRALTEFVIHTDNDDVARTSGVPNIHFLPPYEFHIADAYLKALLKRCSYLRGSVGKKRRQENPRQREITTLMNTARLEFRLSKSPLYASFKLKLRSTNSSP